MARSSTSKSICDNKPNRINRSINRITTNQKIDFHKTRVVLECITESDHCFKRQIFRALLGTQDDDRHHQDTKHLKVSHHKSHSSFEITRTGMQSSLSVVLVLSIEESASRPSSLIGLYWLVLIVSKYTYAHRCEGSIIQTRILPFLSLSHTFLDTTH